MQKNTQTGSVNYMDNMEKYSKRGYYVTFNMPVYHTKNMDKTSEWFLNILGWFGGTCARNDKGKSIYGCVYDYPGEIFDILPQRGFYLFQGEPSQGMVGFMAVQGGIGNFYKFVKGNGWDKITEPAIQSWGANSCFVTTIDENILQFYEIK
jgi:AraC family transcriptional regulator